MLTVQAVAAAINGREYPFEATRAEEASWKEAGIVVAFGNSDDLAEFRGAIHDELGAWNGATLYLHSEGVLDEEVIREEYGNAGMRRALEQCPAIGFVWCDKGADAAWTIKTTVPHATFDIVEDGETQSRGIVFSVADLPVLAL